MSQGKKPTKTLHVNMLMNMDDPFDAYIDYTPEVEGRSDHGVQLAEVPEDRPIVNLGDEHMGPPAQVEQALVEDVLANATVVCDCGPYICAKRATSRGNPIPGASAGRFVYRADIDGLRAVAVMAVVIFHMDHAWLPGGFTGVDIFFVISGYVVSSSLLRKPSETVRSYLLAFYARRVKRLTPALLAMVAATTFVMALLLPPSTIPDYLLSGVFGLIGMSNNYFATKKETYFEHGQQALEFNPFTHTWSLGVEEQFYLLFPWLLALACRERAVRTLSSQRVLRGCSASSILVSTFVASFLISLYLSAKQQQLAFYTLPSRFWQLMSGGILFNTNIEGMVEAQKSTARAQWLLSKWAYTCVELIAVLCMSLAFALTSPIGFPVPWSLLALVSAWLTIGLGCLPRQRWSIGVPSPLLSAILSSTPMAYIGRLSYPLYLWHWPVFVLQKWTIGLRTTSQQCASLILTIALAASTYHLLESRVRRWKPKREWFSLLALLPLVALAVAVLCLLRGPFHGVLYLDGSSNVAGSSDSVSSPLDASPASPPIVWAPQMPPSPHPPTRPSPAPLLPWNMPQTPPPPPLQPSPAHPPPSASCTCNNNSHPTLHQPPDVSVASPIDCFTPISVSDEVLLSAVAVDAVHDPQFKDTYWQHPCYHEYPTWEIAETAIAQCLDLERGVGVPSRAIFLVGDSHAAMTAEGLRRAVEGVFSLAWVAIGTGCTLDYNGGKFGLNEGSIECGHWVERVIAVLNLKVMAGDVVIYRIYGDYFDSSTVGFIREKLYRVVASKGAKLVLVGDSPKLNRPGSVCLLALEPCDVPREAAMREANDAAMLALAQEHADIFFFSLFDLYCEPTRCRAVIPGTDTFWLFDKHHFTTAGAMYLWPFWCSFFSSHDWFR